MSTNILSKIKEFLIDKPIETLPGNIIIGKGKIENIFIEIRYIFLSDIYLQTLIDDVWSEESVWGNDEITKAERLIIYICHRSITIEKSDLLIDKELNLSNKFSKTTKRFITITNELEKLIFTKYPTYRNRLVPFHKKTRIENKPIISIITTVYNNAKLLEQTIQSVINQSFDNYEYVIKDAGSKDHFSEIAEKYRPYITRTISNNDKGVYYGMHEGIMHSSGKFILCLNSDDIFAYSNVLEDVDNSIKNSQANAIYGNILIHKNGISRLKISNLKNLYRESSIYHPSLFLEKTSYIEIGGFNFDYKIAADIDLILRLLKNKKTFSHLNKATTIFRLGGVSTVNFQSYKEEIKCRLNFKLINIIGYTYITLKTLKHLLFK